MTNATLAKKTYADVLAAGLVRGPVKHDGWIYTFYLPESPETGFITVHCQAGRFERCGLPDVWIHVTDTRGRYHNHSLPTVPHAPTLDDAITALRELAALGVKPEKYARR